MIESKTVRPSSLPRIRSEARSGWGIRPRTFPASLRMPAIEASEPLTLAASVSRAAGVAVAEDDLFPPLESP